MRQPNRRHVLAGLAAATATALLGGRVGARPPAPETVAPLGDDFLWGVAASGFQSEGNAPDSNWVRYIAAGKTEDPYLDSIDFYGRFRSDIGLAAQLGVRVYRIGIEWARLQPRPGEWDPAGFRFYDNVIAAIEAAGMRPMLTLDHWVYPGWEVDRGGWRNPAMVDDWLANARAVVDRYAAHDPLWITFNEPAMYVLNELRHGGIGIGDVAAMQGRIALAHNTIYDHIHRVHPSAMVSSNVAYIPTAEDAVNGPLIDRIGAKLDYIGIDYYYGFSPESLLAGPPDMNRLWTMPLQAEGIYYALQHYARRFPGRPLYIVENGMPTENGRPRADGYTRADLLRDTVYWLQRAKADGMNLIGYNYWSLTDNYEWGSYTPRFGLYTVDVLADPALTRRPTDAVPAYADITRAGGVPPRYRPTRGPADCSFVDAVASCADPVRVPR
ncbi:glycoside hydrolase family 1 protein [Nocardia cyriacigeorgica]|uniref:family 1 glycosylhydrolase n=1 Tax=Nocardia cyriacigeorgica TaxID=135487 RepID=UPI001893F672|nr:family 1 glycosylhydrolase [Nocardia cyriacigeorgica]MBF6090277.1 glycoside hydrolase family 1 protein [Nocardia cyriacigeorgica]MBF6094798.1 glycoside hydrolase family 1 protein [Nocardia cyriacigeorgica]MBF6399186.1 glycoside hydrolase family 1 protein [Nocardia cyriacigeorgica]MBF6404817.1 glycoside hydrolase family 1 protein [Nocardia cyriacigeorgica]